MADWIDVNDRLPKEGEFPWVNIKVNGMEKIYPCKVWEYNESTSFVNAGFEKEKNVTHWRPEA